MDTWTCLWCHADTFRHVESGKIERVPYWPLDSRWERAVFPHFDSAGIHARAFATTTLCGIEAADMLSDDSIMWNPDESASCQACKEMAELVDSRWPRNLRGLEDRG
ncbi:hypothetical protein [Streptacidiphilus jiangxiensis]|nr:hypothetical protein [Streptacidiphilus jiangxiensis]